MKKNVFKCLGQDCYFEKVYPKSDDADKYDVYKVWTTINGECKGLIIPMNKAISEADAIRALRWVFSRSLELEYEKTEVKGNEHL